MPTTYEPIATTTLSSPSTSITFSSIAASWTDLVLTLSTSLSGTISSGGLRFYTNGNGGGSSWSINTLYADGANTYANSRTVEANARLNQLNHNANNHFFTRVNFFSYAGATHKSMLIESAYDENGAGGVDRVVALWRSTSAITSITIDCAVNMNSGTTATLYGILKA